VALIFSDVLRNAQAEANARRGSAGSAGTNFRRRFPRHLQPVLPGRRAGAGGGEERVAEKGTDLEYGLNIMFWQAIKGTQTTSDQPYEECPVCRGTGGNDPVRGLSQCSGTEM